MSNEVNERFKELVNLRIKNKSTTGGYKKPKSGYNSSLYKTIDNTDDSSFYESNLIRLNILEDGSVSYD
jgi:hypothetical protein